MGKAEVDKNELVDALKAQGFSNLSWSMGRK